VSGTVGRLKQYRVGRLTFPSPDRVSSTTGSSRLGRLDHCGVRGFASLPDPDGVGPPHAASAIWMREHSRRVSGFRVFEDG
jgi:hypothetical protein